MSNCHVLDAAEETDGDNSHCLHKAAKAHAGDLVCCWCGDLFMEEFPRSRHGEYAPKVETMKDDPDGSGSGW